MEYHYNYRGGENGGPSQGQPTPSAPNNGGKKQDNDFGAWLLIGIMFLVAWPIGLILLIKKLTDNPQKVKKVASDTAARVRAAGAQQQKKQQTAQSVQKAEKKPSAVEKVTQTPQPSSGGARAMKIIGIILAALGCTGLSAVAEAAVAYVASGAWWNLLSVLFFPTGLLVGGIAMFIGGGVMQRKMRRYAKYLACAGSRDAVPLAHLMKAADVGEAKAERDLEAMVEKGMWGPTAYLDRGNDMLFRSQDAANAYFAAMRANAPRPVAQEPQAEGYEGMLQAIRRANDRIDDPALSAKIDRLETVTGQIFKVIQEQPAKKEKAGTFLNYYLPTTQKLLDSYADFEEAGVSGQNLDQAKTRIADTMDNIIAGFEHQLDDLYRDAAMDIDSDIRVMETMLKRDTSTVADDFGLDGGTAVQMPDTEIE